MRLQAPEGVLLTLEAGECIFAPVPPLLLTTPDFAVRLNIYSEADCAASGILSEVFRFFSELWLGVAAVVSQKPTDFLPKMRAYESGEIIIEQGSVANEVFTLVDGQADPIEYQHSMGAALAARAMLVQHGNELRRRNMGAYSRALAELNRFNALWPSREPPAEPATYQEVLVQGSRVRLALSPYL